MANPTNSNSALPMSLVDHFNRGYTPININAGPGPKNPVLFTPVSVMLLPSMPSLTSDPIIESSNPINSSSYTPQPEYGYFPTDYSKSGPSSPKSRPPATTLQRYFETFTSKPQHNPGCKLDVTPGYGKGMQIPQDITVQHTVPTYQVACNSTNKGEGHVVPDLQEKNAAGVNYKKDDFFVSQDPGTHNVATGVFLVNVFPKRLASEKEYPQPTQQEEEAAALERLGRLTEVSCFRIPQAINIPRKFKKSKNLPK